MIPCWESEKHVKFTWKRNTILNIHNSSMKLIQLSRIICPVARNNGKAAISASQNGKPILHESPRSCQAGTGKCNIPNPNAFTTHLSRLPHRSTSTPRPSPQCLPKPCDKQTLLRAPLLRAQTSARPQAHPPEPWPVRTKLHRSQLRRFIAKWLADIGVTPEAVGRTRQSG